MAHAPGKSYRTGISLVELVDMFPDEQTAQAFVTEERWPDGPVCPHCASDNIQEGAAHKMPYRCRSCRKRFSIKTGTVMEASNIPVRKWVIMAFLLTTNLKGVSSMKLHRDLGVTQKTAWFMAHRIRQAWENEYGPFEGPVEVDESFFGGLDKNRHASQRHRVGGGPVGKTPVAGAKDRATGKVQARVVPDTRKHTLRDFVNETVAPGAQLYTDDAKAYTGIRNRHRVVQHSVGEYVNEQAHTNGVESFWSMLKRGYTGTYHRISPKHLGRYVDEFSGRHNQRPLDTIDQMRAIVRGMVGKRLRYDDLIS